VQWETQTPAEFPPSSCISFSCETLKLSEGLRAEVSEGLIIAPCNFPPSHSEARVAATKGNKFSLGRRRIIVSLCGWIV